MSNKNDARALRKAAAEAEAASARLAAECAAVDRELAAAACVDSINELSRRRARLADDLVAAEAKWLEASEELEAKAA